MRSAIGQDPARNGQSQPQGSEASLAKEVILHLKRYDTAPLNCTVTFIAQKTGKAPEKIHRTIQEMVSEGIVAPWREWQKGAITPYRIADLPKLIDSGVEFTYEEVQLLTAPRGGDPADTAFTVSFGVSGVGRSYILSTWSKDNLKQMSERIRILGFGDGIALKRSGREIYARDPASDAELGYLNVFFRSMFVMDEIDPAYTLYSAEGEDPTAFRKRTIQKLVLAMCKTSATLLEKLDKAERPPRAYVYFFASMLDRYAELAKLHGLPADETERLTGFRDRLITRAGETP